MNQISQRRLRVGLAAASAALLGALSLGTPAVSNETFSIPAAPSSVTVSQAVGGLRVDWDGALGSNPGVSHYIISGGQGTCPVIVGRGSFSTLLPALSTAPITVQVQAVNEYGISAAGKAEAVAPRSISKKHKVVQLLQLSDFHGQIEANIRGSRKTMQQRTRRSRI
jgi:hypothetical protein